MSGIDLASFAASIASLALAAVAIWLSVFFYRMSSELSEGTKEAAKGIGASVERLEKLFDKLYADTFSMMRDTVSDMRRHIWPDDAPSENNSIAETEAKTDAKIEAARHEFKEELSRVLESQELTKGKLDSATREIARLMEHTIEKSRKAEAEAREEAMRREVFTILRALGRTQKEIRADDVVGALRATFPGRAIVDELERLRHDGVIEFSDLHIRPNTIIRPSKGVVYGESTE